MVLCLHSIDTAIDIANGQSLQILVLHVVEVPEQVPLTQGPRLLENGEEEQLLDDARNRIEDANVPAESQIRFARDIATGIVGGVDKHDADALLLGWRGRPRRRDIVLGSFIDRVLGEARCDVFVKRIRRPQWDVDSILVPVTEGPHAELAVELAGTIAPERDADVRLVHVLQSDAGDSATETAEQLLRESATMLPEDVDIDTAILRNDHVAGAITDETANYDLTILGATRAPFLRRKLVGSIAEGVGRSAASEVMIVRRALEER